MRRVAKTARDHFFFATLRFSLLLLILGSVSGSLNLSAQQPATGGNVKLARIEFAGLHRLSREQLLKVSALEIGQTVNVEALDAAAQRLMDSGLVKRLSYRFQTKADQATVTFQIEEGSGGESLVIFDNFIWFTDEELAEAVRREIPSFNGMAANSGNMTDAIDRALQRLLTERKIAGNVEYLPSENIDHTKLLHVFAVRGVTLPICTLHFPGAHSVAEERLIKSSQELLGTEYSRRFAGMFAIANLFPFYRELGQLRATFGQPMTRTAATANCKEGVELTIPVEEGEVYSWEKAEWSGNQVLAAPALDAALGMKPGEVADGLKLDKGMAAAIRADGNKGYMAVSLHPQLVFDDSARQVTGRLEVKEGPQYHMGNLTIKGFSEPLGNYLRGKWEIKAGDVYDQGYAESFFKKEFRDVMRKVVEERQAQGKPAPKKIITEAQPNRNTLTVDVTFELGD